MPTRFLPARTADSGLPGIPGRSRGMPADGESISRVDRLDQRLGAFGLFRLLRLRGMMVEIRGLSRKRARLRGSLRRDSGCGRGLC